VSDLDLLVPSGPTYIDNGDGTCRVEYPEARWATYGGPLPAATVNAVLPWRVRLSRWWFDARCWIAEKVLRVPVGDDW
jgi:hypothetical protein